MLEVVQNEPHSTNQVHGITTEEQLTDAMGRAETFWSVLCKGVYYETWESQERNVTRPVTTPT